MSKIFNELAKFQKNVLETAKLADSLHENTPHACQNEPQRAEKGGKEDCPYCEGKGVLMEQDGQDDYNLEQCFCTYGNGTE